MHPRLITPLTIILGMMVLAFSDNFIALVSERMSVWQFHSLRAALVLPFMALAMAVIGQAQSIWVQRPGAVALRSFFTIAALMLYFAAIPAVGVSLAAAGLFTSPVFVLILSALIFGERVGWRRITGVILGSVGVCLVLEIATQPIRAMSLAPMLGGLFYALNIIWTRRYCQQETAGALAFWNMSMFLIIGTLGMVLTPWIAETIGHLEGTKFAAMPLQVPTKDDVVTVGLLGIAGATGLVLLAIGYRSAPATYSALFDFSFLFWIPLFAWFLHSETLTAPVAGGMVLIVAAGLLALSGADERKVVTVGRPT